MDPWVPRLVKSQDPDPEPTVLLDNLMRLFVSVERVHQDQGYVGVVSLVQILDLLHRQIQKGQVIAHGNDRLGALATHGGTKTSVELDDDQFVQHGLDLLIGFGLLQIGVRSDLQGLDSDFDHGEGFLDKLTASLGSFSM